MKAILYFLLVILLGFCLDGCQAIRGFREFNNEPERRTK